MKSDEMEDNGGQHNSVKSVESFQTSPQNALLSGFLQLVGKGDWLKHYFDSLNLHSKYYPS